jgi:hypothetical protein
MIYISYILDAVTSFMYILIYQDHRNIQSHCVTCQSKCTVGDIFLKVSWIGKSWMQSFLV